MTEPERLVYRSNILGSDKRVTNYGGGNTSSKIMEKDPLTGEDVEVLWVKGSGGDSASIKLDGFSTLYMDKLRALKKLYRGVAHEDEMVGVPPPRDVQPQPARRFDRHAAACLRAASLRRPHASRCDHRHRREQGFARADAGNLRRRDRLAAVEEAGLRARPVARQILRGAPEAKGRRAREPRAVHLGRHAQGVLRADRRDDQQGHRLVRAEDGRQDDFRRPGSDAAGAGRAARHCRQADAGDPRADRQGIAEARAFRRFTGGAGVRVEQESPAAGGARHLLPRPFPAHQDPSAGGGVRSDEARYRRGGRRACGGDRSLSRGLCGLLRALQASGQPGDARCQCGGLSGARRRHADLRQGQGDGADFRRVLRQRHQCDARLVDRLRISRPARAGGVRHRILAARRGQAAAPAQAQIAGRAHCAGHRRGPAASAGRRRGGCSARAPAWCWPISTKRR